MTILGISQSAVITYILPFYHMIGCVELVLCVPVLICTSRVFRFSGVLQEYSKAKDSAYCLRCYLYLEESNTHNGQDAFTMYGFKSWGKVKGKCCSFLKHSSILRLLVYGVQKK